MKFHLATFAAKHNRNMDISDRRVLKDIAGASGLDVVRFEQEITQEEPWYAVEKDHLEARERHNVFGVPTPQISS